MTDRAIRRWMKVEFFSSLLVVRHADLMGQIKIDGSIDLSTCQACLIRLSKIEPEEEISEVNGLKSLDIDGKVIMEHFRITPGRKVGSLLKQAMEMLKNNPEMVKKDILRKLDLSTHNR